MSLKEKLHIADSVNWDKPIDAIEFYEKHIQPLDILSELEGTTYTSLVLSLQQKYIEALYDSKLYSNVIFFIEENQEVFNSIKDQVALSGKVSSERDLFYGMSLGYEKKHRKALKIFKVLRLKDPQNEIYKEWYIGMSKFQLEKILKLPFYLCAVILLLGVFGKYFKLDLPEIFVNISFLLMVFIFGTPWVYQLILKNKYNYV